MERCPDCNGRMMQTLEGICCMNSKCAENKSFTEEGVLCSKCNSPMQYRGLNSWGEPNYACTDCGFVTKL